MDGLVDRKESLKQELRKTQEELETSKENHRYVIWYYIFEINCVQKWTQLYFRTTEEFRSSSFYF